MQVTEAEKSPSQRVIDEVITPMMEKGAHPVTCFFAKKFKIALNPLYQNHEIFKNIFNLN